MIEIETFIRQFVRLMHKLGVPSPFAKRIHANELSISATVTLKRGIKLPKVRYLLYETCVSAVHSANYSLLVQSKNTVKSVSSETNVNSIKMEDYVDYVNRQFDILLQHLATGWGQQIKAELATITNNNTLSELQKVRIYVLCKILCVETIFSIFKEICNCFVGLFSVVVNNQRNVCKSIFKIDCNIVSKRTWTKRQMLHQSPWLFSYRKKNHLHQKYAN